MPYDPRKSTRFEVLVPVDTGEWVRAEAARLGIRSGHLLRLIIQRYREDQSAGQLSLLGHLTPRGPA